MQLFIHVLDTCSWFWSPHIFKEEIEQTSSAYLLSIHLIQVRNYLQATGDSYMGNAYQAISNHITDQIHILPVLEQFEEMIRKSAETSSSINQFSIQTAKCKKILLSSKGKQTQFYKEENNKVTWSVEFILLNDIQITEDMSSHRFIFISTIATPIPKSNFTNFEGQHGIL